MIINDEVFDVTKDQVGKYKILAELPLTASYDLIVVFTEGTELLNLNLGSVDHISQYFYRANYHSVHEVKEKSLHKIVFQGSRMSSEPFDDENGNYWHENSVFNNRNYTKQMFALIDEQGNRFEFKTPRYNEKSGNTMESLFAFEYPESLKENTMHQVEMSYVVENKILVTMSIGKYNNYYGSNFESDYFGKPVFIILD